MNEQDPRDPTEDIWPDPAETGDLPDDYVPAYRRQGSVLLGGDPIFTFPTVNPRMRQLQPRKKTRPAALDEAIKREREEPRHRSNLVR